jgi:hypothetical protein
MLDELGEGELLVPLGAGPAEEAHEVQHRLGEKAGAPVVADGRRILALRELGLVRIVVPEKRQVAEDRQLPAEVLVELDVLGDRAQPLLSPDHVAYPHEAVVDHVRQVVGGKAVGLEDHLIVDGGPVLPDLAAEEIRKHALALDGNLHSDHVALAGSGARLRFLDSDRPAAPVVAGEDLRLDMLGPHRLESLPGAETAIGVALLQELLDVLAVDREPLALPVGSVGSSHVGPLVPGEAEPPQGFEDRLLGLPRRAGAVGVLDAEKELAPVLAGEGKVEKRLVGRSHVRIARGRGRHANANGP